jgi:TRAP-type C4-dicarboxylate transport system permease small subunit
MAIADKLLLRRQRHLKWRVLDPLEIILMVICGLALFGFSLSVSLDILTRTLGHPWLWLQEVTSTLFVYGIFIGTAVATRRNDHLYLTAVAEAMHGASRLLVEIVIRAVVLAVAGCLIYFGYINFLRGFGSFRLPSNTPIASLYATALIIPSRRKSRLPSLRLRPRCRRETLRDAHPHPRGDVVLLSVVWISWRAGPVRALGRCFCRGDADRRVAPRHRSEGVRRRR